jgi:predicted MFS family arabinose efflux permease
LLFWAALASLSNGRAAVSAARPPIISRALLQVFGATFGTTVSFYLLLSVVPLYATSVGAGEVGAGLTTGALMFATVAAELVTPALIARFGYRGVLAVGLVLLGLPALALPAATSLGAILGVSVVRGFGFAIVVVVGSALVASLVPRERRGEGLGVYGVVVSAPSVVGLPLGLWLVAQFGFPPVFVAGGLAALVGLSAVPGLPGREPAAEEPVGMLAGLRMPELIRPSVVFGATAMAAGVIVTFLPLALTGSTGSVAELALLAQAMTSTFTRWWAGRHGDRHGSARLLMPAVFVSGLGMLALVLIANPIVVIVGMALFGAGFGVAQNASLAMMFERVSSAGYGAVSAVWNLAYDTGLGLGATAFGLVAVQTGYAFAFGLTGVLVLAALLPAWYDQRASDTAPDR